MDAIIRNKYIELCHKLNFIPNEVQYLEYKYHMLTRLYIKLI